jgi:hypothetical protein
VASSRVSRLLRRGGELRLGDADEMDCMERIHPPARFAGPSLFEGTPMPFFYLDETGCTGGDLTNAERPIFVIGGISVTDEGWRTTSDRFSRCLRELFWRK